MGKKLLSIIAVMLTAALFLTACSSYKHGPISGDYSSTTPAVSNGGFVSEYGAYTYFINGIDYYTSSNKFGTPVKASLMRVKTADLFKDDAEYQTVVPSLMVTGSNKQGFFIKGDYVYYATPTTAKNKSGTVESSYLDFTRTKLDGTGTLKSPMFRLSSNSVDFRYMEFGDDLYIVYEEESVVYSYNVKTKAKNKIIEDYTSVMLPAEIGQKTIYYTKKVIIGEGGIEKEAKYNEVYSIDGNGENNRLVLSGKGKAGESSTDINNTTITLVKAADGYLYYSAKGSFGDQLDFGYVADISKFKFDSEDNSDAIDNFEKAVRVDTAMLTYFTATAVFIGADEMIYLKDTKIFKYDFETKDNLQIVEKATSPTFMYIIGDYLYYYESADKGNKILRINITGEEKNYIFAFGKDDDGDDSGEVVEFYGAEQIGNVMFTGSWFTPEIIGDTLFFVNADSLDSNYVYIYNINYWDIEQQPEDEEDAEYKNYVPKFIGIRNTADEEAYQTALEEQEENK